MRVGIVGAGPRGLGAIERLWAHWAEQPLDEPLDVVVHDPRPPGCGAAYDPGQPDFLRLNVSSAVVGAAWPGTGAFPSFDQWRLDSRRETPPLDPFPPRALVGRYHDAFWQWLQRHAPRRATLRHRAAHVASVSRADDGWRVDGDPCDEVLLATGHQGQWTGALASTWTSVSPHLVPAVFPVQRWLSPTLVPAGSAVVMRGAALTFIDAALALTEGRGGRFEGSWTSGLTYRPSGDEPRVIWPVGRRGRWMTPKPQPGTPTAAVPEQVVRTGERRIADAPSAAAALDVVAEVAVALGADAQAARQLVHDDAPTTSDPTAALRAQVRWLADASGPPDAAWGVGHAWRGLYDALRERFEGTEDAAGFAAFRAAADRLEAVAFGPPPVNAAKLLALVAAGLVDASTLTTARITGQQVSGLPGPADVLVDAVLAPPGVHPFSVVGRLVADGWLTRARGRRGVAVGPDASALDDRGRLVPGLACIGRATEDVVIGNDTLNRRLHPAVDGWAARVAARAAARGGR